jgi:type IV secretory pathway TrbF-like protein
MRLSNQEVDKQASELLAKARAIRFALQGGAITYESAKKRVKPLLVKVNKVGLKIAKKYGRGYKKIRFTDL